MTTSTSTAPHDGSNRTGRTAGAGSEFVIHEPRGSKPATWTLGLAHQDRVVRWSLPYGLPDRTDVDQPAIQVGDRLRHFIDLDGLDEEATEPTSLAVWDRGSLDVGSWRHDRVEVELRGGKIDGAFAIARDRDDHWIVHLSGPTAAAWEELPNVVLPMSASVGHPRDAEPAAWYEPCWRGFAPAAGSTVARPPWSTRTAPTTPSASPSCGRCGRPRWPTSCCSTASSWSSTRTDQLDHAALQARLRAADGVEAKRLSLRYPATFLAVDLLHQNGRCLLPLSAAARPGAPRGARLPRQPTGRRRRPGPTARCGPRSTRPGRWASTVSSPSGSARRTDRGRPPRTGRSCTAPRANRSSSARGGRAPPTSGRSTRSGSACVDQSASSSSPVPCTMDSTGPGRTRRGTCSSDTAASASPFEEGSTMSGPTR